jgi:hypothetical protein
MLAFFIYGWYMRLPHIGKVSSFSTKRLVN